MIQDIAWENFPISRGEEIYRMPSVGSIYTILHQRGIPDQRDKNIVRIASIKIDKNFYILNPTNDIRMSFIELEEALQRLKLEEVCYRFI